MNNENFAGIMGTVKQAEVTSGVCGYDTENRYACCGYVYRERAAQ